MQILNFHFLTIHCYGFTDNDEVNSNLCAKDQIELCILCKESIRKSSEGRNWRRVSLKIVNNTSINVEAGP